MSDNREENIGRRNVALRRELRALHEHADAIFNALLDTSGPVTAMGELWGSGYFDCGPEDYEAIVERCLEALRLQDASRTNPIIPLTMCAAD